MVVCGQETDPRWLWHAIDHQTGMVLAYVFGRRQDEVFLKLKALLDPFGITHYYTDYWGAYTRHLDPEEHTGQTQHAANRAQAFDVTNPDQTPRRPPRSPNGAACPSPKPRRASRRRLAASAGCARRPPLSAGELGETSGGGAGATGWVGARGGKGRSRAAAPAQPQPRWLPGRRPGRALRRGPVACRLPTGLARRGCGRLRARPGKACARRRGRADPRRGHQRAQGGRGWADAGGWDCVKSGFIFPIPGLSGTLSLVWALALISFCKHCGSPVLVA